MEDQILADQVRAIAFERFLRAGFAKGREASVRAGDVHSALSFNNRVPLVVASLRARKFRDQYGLELVDTIGPRTSTTTTFVFRKMEQASEIILKSASDRVWAEISSLEHGHGGAGWELGRWLWSPTSSTDGAARYAVMEVPVVGDLVFHFIRGIDPERPKRRVLYGFSTVAAKAYKTASKPNLSGDWGDAEAYYRIELGQFHELNTKPPMDELEVSLSDIILAEIADRPKYYPYAPYGSGFRMAQGIYLSRLSPTLADAFREIAEVSKTASPTGGLKQAQRVATEFAEGERSRREAAFFKRNPRLRAEAIATYGYKCRGCLKTLSEIYGRIGEGYIEIHHLNPLGERSESGSEVVNTTVADVIPLCANCHRMVHRRRPALTLDELQDAMREQQAG